MVNIISKVLKNTFNLDSNIIEMNAFFLQKFSNTIISDLFYNNLLTRSRVKSNDSCIITYRQVYNLCDKHACEGKFWALFTKRYGIPKFSNVDNIN